MFDKALYDYLIASVVTTQTLVFGTAENTSPPVIGMVKISDLERPNVLCQKQGTSGKVMIQFASWSGGANSAQDSSTVVAFLNVFKILVAGVKGPIGVTPDDYRIWNNMTGSVKLIGEGEQSLMTWGAFFESILWWEKV